jgi:hypothetical protein
MYATALVNLILKMDDPPTTLRDFTAEVLEIHPALVSMRLPETPRISKWKIRRRR